MNAEIPGMMDVPDRFSRALVWGMGIALVLASLWAVTGPFRSHSNWMYFEQDDFFYYLKVAQNLAAGKGSTFNGLVPTNGYHPLWLLVLTAVLLGGGGPKSIFVFLAISICVASLACYVLGFRLSRNGLGDPLSAVLAAFLAVYCFHLFTEGMEVTLAVPLMFGLLVAVQNVPWWSRAEENTWLRGLVLGLIASAMILARLDTAIFAVLLALAVLGQTELRRRLNMQLAFGVGLGLVPVPIYLLINRTEFGTWMPISGMAKELKLHHGFTSKSWQTFTELTGPQWVNVVGIVLAMVVLPFVWKRMRPIDRALAAAALTFPLVYFSALSWLSEWRLWGWYFYSLRPAFLLAILVLLQVKPLRQILSSRVLLLVLAIITLARIAALRWDLQTPTLADAAAELQSFAKNHPGVYAMGDRSGTAGYLVAQPMVQTEGLMMDRGFLDAIRAQQPLIEVLGRYNVRYYVATAWKPYSGCFHAVEPWQAGPHSAHMQAELCQPPVAEWTHDGVETLVFDLAKVTK